MLLYWRHLRGAFPISGKATIGVSLSVCPSALSNSLHSRRKLMKYDALGFFKNLSKYSSFIRLWEECFVFYIKNIYIYKYIYIYIYMYVCVCVKFRKVRIFKKKLYSEWLENYKQLPEQKRHTPWHRFLLRCAIQACHVCTLSTPNL